MKRSETLRSYVAELDALGLDDREYRGLLSTGSKDALRKGETWRKRVLHFAEMAERSEKEQGR